MQIVVNVTAFVQRFVQEPPFRLFARMLIKRLPFSLRMKALWDVVPRPQYLVGLLAAAAEAKRDGIASFSAFEFGVAGGNGLLAMQEAADQVERMSGIRISVYGFDAGSGLPELADDYRDFPDRWKAGDYPMDEDALRRRLMQRTSLIIGNIAETLPKNMPSITDPIGFVAVDVDLYSSSKSVLRMFLLPKRRMLKRVYMYFDDIDLPFVHRFAGELLSIDEFNATSSGVKIDCWRGIKKHRPFPEHAWLDRMYIAHDLDAISRAVPSRETVGVIGLDDRTGATG